MPERSFGSNAHIDLLILCAFFKILQQSVDLFTLVGLAHHIIKYELHYLRGNCCCSLIDENRLTFFCKEKAIVQRKKMQVVNLFEHVRRQLFSSRLRSASNLKSPICTARATP